VIKSGEILDPEGLVGEFIHGSAKKQTVRPAGRIRLRKP